MFCGELVPEATDHSGFTWTGLFSVYRQKAGTERRGDFPTLHNQSEVEPQMMLPFDSAIKLQDGAQSLG